MVSPVKMEILAVETRYTSLHKKVKNPPMNNLHLLYIFLSNHIALPFEDTIIIIVSIGITIIIVLPSPLSHSHHTLIAILFFRMIFTTIIATVIILIPITCIITITLHSFLLLCPPPHAAAQSQQSVTEFTAFTTEPSQR